MIPQTKHILLLIALVIGGSIVADGQGPTTGQERGIELVRFDIAPSVSFPITWVDTMMAETVDELTRTKKFDRVMLVQLADHNSSGARLQLTGKVVKYQPGSKATRFWLGMGAGKAKAVASIKLVDTTTGKVLLERTVDGSVIKGTWGGGDASGVTRGVAVEIAKRVKKLFP